MRMLWSNDRDSLLKTAEMVSGRRFLTVAEGSVRSGKTVFLVFSFALYVCESPERYFLLAGRTMETIERNCIYGDFGILSMIPGAVYRHEGRSSAIIFWSKTRDGDIVRKVIYVRGASNVRDYQALRGATIGGAFCDEVNLMDKSFVYEVFNRTIKSSDRRHFFTLNPDNPLHWFYSEMLDRYDSMSEEEKAELGGYAWYHYTPRDNPALTEKMISSMEMQYPKDSFRYKRYILGERCGAEGLIYDLPIDSLFRDLSPEMWDKDGTRRLMKNHKPLIDIRYCGIDFGADHPTVMTFGGFLGGTKTDFRIVCAYYDEKSGKTTYQHYLGFLEKCSEMGVEPMHVEIAIDPAAKVMRDELLSHGLRVIKAKNDVLPGINFTRDCLAKGRIILDKSLVHHRDELGTYSYDPSASEKGLEKPIKVKDDALDSLRYLVYTFLYPIWR